MHSNVFKLNKFLVLLSYLKAKGKSDKANTLIRALKVNSRDRTAVSLISWQRI